jgi:diguanylate cyclase
MAQKLHLQDDLQSRTDLSAVATDRLQLLERENRDLRITVRRLRQLAFVDGLTGLPNRRHFDTALHAEIRRASRSGSPLGLAICDVDFFKRVNDGAGHAAGDIVLRTLGGILAKQCRRGGDVAARYGGEEFALLMPGVDSEEILVVADKIRAIVADTQIPIDRHRRSIRITVSIGTTSHALAEPCLPAKLVQAADTALYSAKRNGRNRVAYRSLSPA